MKQVYWCLDLEIKEGRLNAFENLMREMVTNTRENEPGTLNYEWSKNTDGSRYHIYERYSDSASALIHLAAFGKVASQFLELCSPGFVDPHNMKLLLYSLYTIALNTLLARNRLGQRSAVTSQTRGQRPSKLLIVGATGGSGRQLVTQALEQGYSVTALSEIRRPSRWSIHT